MHVPTYTEQCTFEQDTCGWQQDTTDDGLDWTRGTGASYPTVPVDKSTSTSNGKTDAALQTLDGVFWKPMTYIVSRDRHMKMFGDSHLLNKLVSNSMSGTVLDANVNVVILAYARLN